MKVLLDRCHFPIESRRKSLYTDIGNRLEAPPFLGQFSSTRIYVAARLCWFRHNFSRCSDEYDRSLRFWNCQTQGEEMRVNLSSLFEDLRDHRAAVTQVLRKLGHDVVAIELFNKFGINPPKSIIVITEVAWSKKDNLRSLITGVGNLRSRQ